MNRRYPPSLIQTPKHDCQSQGSIRSSCYWCCNSPESCDSTQRLRIQKSETTHHDRDHQLEYIRGVCMMPLVDTKIDYTPWRHSFEKIAKSLNISELVRVIESSLCSSCSYTTLMFQILATTQNLSSEGLWTSKKEHKCTSPSSSKHPSIPSMLVDPLFRSSSRRLWKISTQSRCTSSFHVNSSHNLCVAMMSPSRESTVAVIFELNRQMIHVLQNMSTICESCMKSYVYKSWIHRHRRRLLIQNGFFQPMHISTK